MGLVLARRLDWEELPSLFRLEVIMTKERYRKYKKDKEHCEDTLFLLGVLVLLALIGQWCQYYGYVIYLDF